MNITIKSRRKFILGLLAGILVTGIAGCSTVSEIKQQQAKSIIFKRMPDFETQAQKSVKSKNPNVIGNWSYKFETTNSEDTVLVKYGIFGVDWVGFLFMILITIITLGIFSPGYTTGAYMSLLVNLKTQSFTQVSS